MPKNLHKKRRPTSYATTNSYQELEDRKMMATFMVSNLGDGVVNAAGDLPGSLRQAIFDANETPGADSIEFAGDASTGTITLVEGELQVTESVDIVGPGASNLTISGADTTGIFWFGDESGASTFNVSGLTLTGGNGETDAGLPNSFGGAVLFFDQFGGDDTLNISDSAIVDNTAVRGGGLHALLGTLNITDTTISGNSSTRVSGPTGGGGLSLEQVDTTLERVFVDNNTSNRPGGGIVSYVESGTPNDGDANLTIIDSSITNNNAAQGGGINNETGSGAFDARLTLVGTTVSGNETTSSGGGIRDSAGVITISNSLIADNVANNVGGGILTTNTDLSIFNSTVSGNRGVDSSGGALRIFGNRSLDPAGTGESITQIVNSTVAFNESGFNGAISGEAQANSSVTIGFQNSIFSDNAGSPNFGSFFSGTTFVSAGHNISDDNSGNLFATGDQPNTNPLLLPLADNGGLTRTHALRLESPAIDAGSNALAVDADGNALATDQRGTGFDRILDGTVDVGAFESEFFQGDLIVSSATDIVDNDFSSGQLSLREAVLIANARDGVDTITFDAALNGQTITLTDDALTGELQVTESVDIVGPGAADLTVSGADTTGIFWFGDDSGASTFNVSGLTLTGGNGETDAGLPNSFGGAVLFFDQFGGDDTLNISDSAIVDNTAVRGGGLHALLGTLNITDTTISGNSSTRVSGPTGGGGLSLEQVDTTLERVFVDNNTSNRPGGGIVSYVESGTPNDGDANLTIIDSSITNNNAAQGGGINNETGSGAFDARLTLVGTTVSGNETTSSGGGIRDSAGVITISNSLIADNVANNVGGGILTTNTDLSIFNSTVSGNRGVDSSGGALRIFGDRSLDPAGTGESITQIVNSTVAFNESGLNGAISGEAKANSSVTIGFQNSIFSDNAGSPNFGSFGSGTTFVSAGHNISDDNSGNLFATGDRINTDPLLLPLLDNGGQTRTHALEIGSPAINAGNNALAVDAEGNPLATDQRGEGFERIVDGTPATVDIGAFENVPFEGELVVSNTSDVVDGLIGEGQLSLREAIQIANDRDGFDSITFAPDVRGTITLTGSELEVTDSIEIVGPGAGLLTLDANNDSRVFFFGDVLDASEFSVSGLTLINGDALSSGGIEDHGGAILFFDAFGQGGEDSLQISNVVINNSSAAVGGGLRSVLGSLDISNTTFSNNEATGNVNGFSGGGLALQQSDTELRDVTVTGNTAQQRGGGIVNFVGVDTPTIGDSNLTIINGTIADNSANIGGGIHNETRTNLAEASLSIASTSISANNTSSTGAGIQSDAGEVDIVSSLISDNIAGAAGAGIFASNASLELSNSTVSGNRSANNAGGAIRLFATVGTDPDGTGQSVTEIKSSTIAFNTSGGTGAITAEAADSSQVVVRSQNSIFANNSGSPNFGSFTSGSGVTAFISEGHNLSDDDTGNLTAVGDLPDTDPLLSPLADNGGPTFTHSPTLGSPAIDAGNSTFATDQRGLERPFDFDVIPNASTSDGSDIGAVEVSPAEEPSLVVTTNLDVVNAFDQLTSIREAIAFADSTAGEDTITFDGSLAGETITLAGSQLEISDSLVIDGSALSSPITIDADGQSRVLKFVGSSGDLTIDSLVITGGLTTGDGAGIQFDSSDTLTVTNSTISGNSAGGDGGAIGTSSGSVTVTSSTFIGNTAGDDGGAIEASGQSLIVHNTSIVGNTAQDFGGGILFLGEVFTMTDSTISGNTAVNRFGGGLHLESSTATITSSTIDGNSTPTAGGGGINSPFTDLTVVNTTISGNTSGGGFGFGGGGILATLTSARTTIINSTIVQNDSGAGAGGIFTDEPLTVENSIIADNTLNGVSSDIALEDADDELTINHSLIGNADNLGEILGNVGNLFGTEANPLDPQLGELADNGGPTLTHALLPGSPAINAGSNDLAVDSNGNPLLFDQRGEGFDRILDGTVDIGATEVQADVSNAPGIESIVIQDGSEQRSVIRGITVTFDSIVNVADGAFELTNDAGQAVDIAVALSQVGNQTIATLTFSGALADSTGSLVDGQYSLRTIDDLITDNAGNTADSDGDGTSGNDRLDDFFRLYGDADGDGSVGFFDYALFRNALFSQEGDDEFDIAFDANGDGVIDLLDIQDFRDNFGASLKS